MNRESDGNNKFNEFVKTVSERITAIFKKTAVIKTKKKNIVYHPARVAASAVVILLIVALVGAFISNGGSVNNVNIPFEAGSAYRVKPMGSKMVLYNNRCFKIVNKRGNVEHSSEQVISEPLLETAGKYILLSDLSGNHFSAVYKNGKKQHDFQIKDDIISAKITKQGYAAVATDTDGYKGKVTLYNGKGREVYVWNSGSGYITDVALTDNGRYLAVAQMATDKETVGTKIQIIDTGKGEVVSTTERDGEVAVNLKFASSNKLLCVTDNHICAYNRSGKELFSISLEGRNPSLYGIDNGIIAVNVKDNRGSSVLEMYSSSGKLKGVYTSSGDIRHLAVSGSSAIVAEQSGIIRVTSNGKAKKPVPVDHDIKDLGYFSGGKKAMVVGSAQAETVNVR